MDQNFFINLKQTIGRNRRNSTIPVIRDAFAGWIRAHRKECSEKSLPSVSLLAETLGVARQTIRKVYLSLEEQRLITRNKGERHWFIRPFHNSSLLNIALLLPMRFSDYYLPSTEYGQRHFGVFSGIADRALEQGYALIPMRLPPPGATPEEIAAALDTIRRNYVGVIHLGNRCYDKDLPLAALLEQKDLPQIAIDCEFEQPWVASVTFDPERVARTVICHLRENGHRNIGIVYPCVKPPERIPPCKYMMINRQEVLEPFRKETMKFDRIFEIVSANLRSGDRFRRKILETIRSPDPPTAFWCRNDLTAMELIRILKSAGYSVPKDFSVIGFDDLSGAGTFDPPLTTLRNPVYELGYTAMSLLDQYITHGLDSIQRLTRLAPVLCIRKSVSPKTFPMTDIQTQI